MHTQHKLAHISTHTHTAYLLQALLDHVRDAIVGGKEQREVLRLFYSERVHGTFSEDALSSTATE